ncbi:NACHT domain-containing NTPase [Trichocoleus sp. FACHB-6]|uniref:NACHT domain-containing protein n=1 Tax=Cyanophyceae TaxID=3028117 RepID=UPI00168303B9|nr:MULTISPECIES: NACHT domain-containing NTPase [unclassified Trichocoleus]MBD1908809.1 NACHT domain-containing NTPase [Trichocoleus sp. FACHB-832]MBD2064300.1 NACHT domain-containing NTPase [Trichocoleus sp. FACHB-6]
MTGRVGRSLQASTQGLEKAKKALIRDSLSQNALAKELLITRQTVSKFFRGERVDRQYFVQICEKLGLEWEDIVAKPSVALEPQTDKLEQNASPIDLIVQELRQKGSANIQQKCGTMRVLDMSQPINLNNIYTSVNVLEKISGRRRLEIANLIKICVPEDFDRPGFGKVCEERVSGIKAVEKYSKLLVLGKPGAGKTTFLKHLAIQCNLGIIQADKIPVFISLKNFAEAKTKPNLLESLTQQVSGFLIDDEELIEKLLIQGNFFILLDGLDEVREKDSNRIFKEIIYLSEHFYANSFVITCRLAAKEYTFEQFTEVEIADFDDQQIFTFAKHWFQHKSPSKAELFIQNIKANQAIKELATNPLLLTMLCLVFEELDKFPSNYLELYKEGVDILLKHWDAKRNIERDKIYKNLSLQSKEDLLSKIALITFKRGEYFFKPKEIKQHITDYIRNLPGANTAPEALQLDSEAVLKSIEAQHGLLVERAKGIYSFSHLTFHEYFTARAIADNLEKINSENTWEFLGEKITYKSWREVFLLTVGMLSSADKLLLFMKQKIDELIAQDQDLQKFLTWVNRKSCAVSSNFKPVIVRAFYLDLDLARAYGVICGSLDLARGFDKTLTRALSPDLTLDLALDRVLALNFTLDLALDPDRVHADVFKRAINHATAIDFGLEGNKDSDKVVSPTSLSESLEQLNKQLPHFDKDREQFRAWWKDNGGAWIEKLRAMIVYYRDIGHHWQFSNQQKEMLKKYYEANQLLVHCLNSDCYVTQKARQEIEETMLLPIVEIEQYKNSFLEQRLQSRLV